MAGSKSPSPRRVAAGRINRAKRGPLTDAGRERLRQAAKANRPWEHSTGPKTLVGKRASSANGKVRQVGPISVRAAKADLAVVRRLIRELRDLQRSITVTA